jgi:hypothetical protein
MKYQSLLIFLGLITILITESCCTIGLAMELLPDGKKITPISIEKSQMDQVKDGTQIELLLMNGEVYSGLFRRHPPNTNERDLKETISFEYFISQKSIFTKVPLDKIQQITLINDQDKRAVPWLVLGSVFEIYLILVATNVVSLGFSY